MLGIGLIGYGYWGPNLARVAAQNPRARLLAIADRDEAALERARRQHPGTRRTREWQEIVDNAEISAVLISTPVNSHFEMALAALSAGKHVLVEKPMARSSAQCAFLVGEAAQRSLTLMVDHTFLYTPAVRRIKEMTDAGELGRILYYDSTRINLGLVQRDVNVVWDLAVHDLAILDHLFEAAPQAISANGGDMLGAAHETLAHVTLYYGDGAMAHINTNWLSPVKMRRTLIGGTRKMVVYDDLEPDEKLKVYDRGAALNACETEDRRARLVSYRTGDMWAPHLPLGEALAIEFEHFTDCIETGARPLTSGSMGLRIVEMLEAASCSLAQRGQPVELSRLRMAS
ncbi:Gfo/Idh/MocA family protein [Aureimonas sp. AU40]|uniref:Gfo/Idh/MocA family protein n=1 Tax=Aureimonas sp. AU40 TaxID=1637747 RepID=UPI000780CBA1|nr:Gfo/Idh/MocA family oxidoreductase [Aureimonas sp. AU40]